MNLGVVWREFWASVHPPRPSAPCNPLDDPDVQRAQHEADEIQAVVRMLQLQASARHRQPTNE